MTLVVSVSQELRPANVKTGQNRKRQAILIIHVIGSVCKEECFFSRIFTAQYVQLKSFTHGRVGHSFVDREMYDVIVLNRDLHTLIHWITSWQENIIR